MNLTLRISNYITKYAPSKKKLIEYISKKKPTFPIPVFLEELNYDEDMMINMWMRSFLTRSIWERDIQIKLMKKWFPKELILTKIELSQEEIRDWSLHAQEIESTIGNLLKKGKSTQIIRMTLSGKYPYFKNEISEFLASYSDESGLIREIEKYRRKYDLSQSWEKQKFYAAIQRKGFRYEDIKNIIRKESEAE